MKKLFLLFVLISFKLYAQSSNAYILGAVNPVSGACLETDVFTNSNGTTLTTHDSNWYFAVSGQTLDIQSNNVNSEGDDEGGAGQSECAWTDNQYSEIIAVTSSSNAYMGAAVRVGGSNSGDYYGYYGGAGDQDQLFIMNGGSWSEIDTSFDEAANGELVRLEISGTALTAFVQGSETLSGTNSTHSSGDTGIAVWNSPTGRGDNWEGGDL